jgi:Protein of unknown function (DUF2934)
MLQQTISDLAYALWQARGSPEGSADIDWTEAERQVMSSRRSPAVAGDSISSDPLVGDEQPDAGRQP